MASPKRSTEGKFESRCGRPYESEQDRDRHEGQCDDCIDLNHGVDPDDNSPKGHKRQEVNNPRPRG